MITASNTSRAPVWLRLILLALVALMVVSPLAGCNGDDEVVDENVTPDDPNGDDNGDDDSDPATMTVQVYFGYAGEAAFAVPREIPSTEAPAEAAIEEMLAGPTDAEMTTWPMLGSDIPTGTELLGITIADGVASVDFSEEFESGAGSWSVISRIAQVVYTLAEFDSVDAVEFLIEGAIVTTFSSEGLELNGPQTPDDYHDLVPIEA